MTSEQEAVRWRQPERLEGDLVTLEALESSHVPALEEAARDGELWRLWFTSVPEPGEGTRRYVEEALAERERGRAMPFAVRHHPSGTVVGSTRFGHIDRVHRRVEVGWTWYARSMQRTGVNAECKLLLLTHAFEVLDVIAVELRTHFFNHASRRAIEGIGGRLDGILRNHQRMPDGTLRDTVVYSILPHEWPTVKSHLEHRLRAPSPRRDQAHRAEEGHE